MEMTFPHLATRQHALDRRHNHDAIVATIVARQANSRTVRAMLMARRASFKSIAPSDDAVEQRIHYFGSHPVDGEAPCGSFVGMQSTPAMTENKTEFGVYQIDSANIKALGLPTGGTGEQANLVGHGASRTI